MSFDLPDLERNIAEHGPVVRVVLAETRGSVPRGAGTGMLVWRDGQSGTIGGGALEFEACRRARSMLTAGQPWEVWSLPLGPGLGQCCGGAVALLAERYDAAPDAADFPLARAVKAHPGIVPARVEAARKTADSVKMVEGWLIEPLAKPAHDIWVWGAGHVGRALIEVLAPLPDLALTWLDVAPERFPEAVPGGVTCLPAPDLPRALPLAPKEAHHLILTYSHDYDLALCDAALRHDFTSCGLIGSATKWARFRSRLQAMGHSDAEISRITCPIGDPALGKHPQAIALGVATRQLSEIASTRSADLPKLTTGGA